jgi:16S rRNA (uracil1498-N3)-methyltransferase
MNLILLFEDDFIAPDTVRLSDRRFAHADSVLKAAVGDELRVGLCNGKTGTATVTAKTEGAVEMRVALEHEPLASLPLTIICALPRPPTFVKVIECAVAMGVKKFVFIQTARVEKSYWQSPVLLAEKLRYHVMRALEQAGDTVFPDIVFKKRFKPFVEDELSALSAGTRKLAAHPGAGSRECPRGLNAPVTLVIGPEGGLIPHEVESLVKAGFETVTFGKRILRVEHAVPVLLSRLF